MDTSNTCIDAFKNLNVTTQSFAACCLAKPKYSTGVDFNTDPYLQSIRQSWLEGKFPTECSSCQHAEENNFISRRQGANRWYVDNNLANTDVELVRVDYWTGDLCNLRCMICGPRNSSAWKQELNYPVEHKKVKINELWRDLDLTKIKMVHFNGGEPLLSKEHSIFLESIPVKSQVQVNYNTNGTILPSPELLEIWAKFKLVLIDFSIDDLGDRFEYQRFPAKWDQVCLNLKWFVDNCPVNCMFAVNTTVSILNSANLKNLSDWLEQNFKTNNLGDPIEHRQQPASGVLNTQDIEQRKAEIVRYLNSCDSRRSTDWRRTFPELNQIL